MNDTIKLIAFPGAPNLPIFAGTELGLFARAGVAVDLTTTPSSVYQMENLAAGTFDMAATAVDNVIAYRAGQGAVAVADPRDLFVLMGATTIELSLVAQPDIAATADLKGQSLALDALATGFAFVLYKILEDAGLAPGDCAMVPVGATPERWAAVRAGSHAATLTIEPFTSLARAAGFAVLASSRDAFDHYQGGVFASRRSWATANAGLVEAFILGYLYSLDWVLAPENRADAAEILVRHMPNIKPGAADAVLANVLSPDRGLTPRAALDWAGMATVLDLRRRYGPGGELGVPESHVDMQYYDRAVAGRS